MPTRLTWSALPLTDSTTMLPNLSCRLVG
jgi:hypothetical protein